MTRKQFRRMFHRSTAGNLTTKLGEFNCTICPIKDEDGTPIPGKLRTMQYGPGGRKIHTESFATEQEALDHLQHWYEQEYIEA